LKRYKLNLFVCKFWYFQLSFQKNIAQCLVIERFVFTRILFLTTQLIFSEIIDEAKIMSIKIDTLAQDNVLEELDAKDTAVVGGGGYRRHGGGGYGGGGFFGGYVPGTYTNVTGNTVVSGLYSSAGGSATGIATGPNASSSSTLVAGAGWGSAAVGGSANATTSGAIIGVPVPRLRSYPYVCAMGD
jgi:hypothetical protein